MNTTTKALSLCTLLVIGITAQADPEKEWELVHTITNPRPDIFSNQFGESVALSRDGKTLLVAAATEDCASGPDCGAAYVYRLKHGQWLQEARLAASDETVAVGMPVTRHPPHRSRRAELPHRALASGSNAQALSRVRMQDAGLR